LQQSFAGDITLLHTVGILPVIVHGGGPQISEAMAREGIEPTWVDGLRVTDEATIRVVQKVLIGEVNADIVNLLGRHGAGAIGISGFDAGLFTAEARDPRLGYVGEITRVNTDLMNRLLEGPGAGGGAARPRCRRQGLQLQRRHRRRRPRRRPRRQEARLPHRRRGCVPRPRHDPESTLITRMDLAELRRCSPPWRAGCCPSCRRWPTPSRRRPARPHPRRTGAARRAARDVHQGRDRDHDHPGRRRTRMTTIERESHVVMQTYGRLAGDVRVGVGIVAHRRQRQGVPRLSHRSGGGVGRPCQPAGGRRRLRADEPARPRVEPVLHRADGRPGRTAQRRVGAWTGCSSPTAVPPPTRRPSSWPAGGARPTGASTASR
jgi:hypothetical protein